MTSLEQQIRAAILRALLAARGPMPADSLKSFLRQAFPHVSFTDGDLKMHITDCEELKLVAGTSDDVSGVMWDLTPKGKIKAQSL